MGSTASRMPPCASLAMRILTKYPAQKLHSSRVQRRLFSPVLDGQLQIQLSQQQQARPPKWRVQKLAEGSFIEELNGHRQDIADTVNLLNNDFTQSNTDWVISNRSSYLLSLLAANCQALFKCEEELLDLSRCLPDDEILAHKHKHMELRAAVFNLIADTPGQSVERAEEHITKFISQLSHHFDVEDRQYIQPIRQWYEYRKDVTVQAIAKQWPGALPQAHVWQTIKAEFFELGFTASNSQLALSVCCDEVNAWFRRDAVAVYGPSFDLGGLAGFPFVGQTGFKALLSHVPTMVDGRLVIAYGPHCGVSGDGHWGKVRRFLMKHESTSCGAALGGTAAVRKTLAGQDDNAGTLSETDLEFTYVIKNLMKERDRIGAISTDAEIEVPEVTSLIYELIRERVLSIVVDCPVPVALIGGIIVNTEYPTPDYFHLKHCEVQLSPGRLTPVQLHEHRSSTREWFSMRQPARIVRRTEFPHDLIQER